MRKAIKYLDEHLEEYFMGAFLIGISCIMFVQIFMRLMGSSLPWAEELCRYFYLWSVFLSISFTIRKGIILRVDLLLNSLPRKIRKFVEILLQLITVVLFLFLAYYSLLTVLGVKASFQTSPAMELPMYIIYSIIPVGFILASVRSLQNIFFIIREKLVNPETDFSEAS